MINTSPYDYAELINIFAEGLRMGLLTKDDLTNWADPVILRDDQPDIFFIDLALSQTTSDCLEIISQACQSMAAETTIRPLLCALYKLISSGQKTALEALTRVSGLETSELLMKQERVVFGTLVYAADLIEVAQVTESELEQDAISFLAIYQGYTIENFSRWDDLDKEVEEKLSACKFHCLPIDKANSSRSWWQVWKS
jgi:hypothetical protein